MLRPEDSGVRVGAISSNFFIVNDDVMFYCDDAYRIGSAKFFYGIGWELLWFLRLTYACTASYTCNYHSRSQMKLGSNIERMISR
jgi:hypothetical protein